MSILSGYIVIPWLILGSIVLKIIISRLTKGTIEAIWRFIDHVSDELKLPTNYAEALLMTILVLSFPILLIPLVRKSLVNSVLCWNEGRKTKTHISNVGV